jgi:hypothetical protein
MYESAMTLLNPSHEKHYVLGGRISGNFHRDDIVSSLLRLSRPPLLVAVDGVTFVGVSPTQLTFGAAPTGKKGFEDGRSILKCSEARQLEFDAWRRGSFSPAQCTVGARLYRPSERALVCPECSAIGTASAVLKPPRLVPSRRIRDTSQ